MRTYLIGCNSKNGRKKMIKDLKLTPLEWAPYGPAGFILYDKTGIYDAVINHPELYQVTAW